MKHVKFDGFGLIFRDIRLSATSGISGDGEQSQPVESISHTFKHAGKFNVNLELVLKSNTTGEIQKTGISKMISVFESGTERASYVAKTVSFCYP